MKSILDPSFCYTSSLHTDVRKTFERVRRELVERGERVIALSTNERSALPLSARLDPARGSGAQENGRMQRPFM